MPQIADADNSGKAEVRLHRKERVGDEREMRQNSIENAGPNNDQAASNSPRRNDATVNNAQKAKKRKPSTELHADRLAAPIDKDDVNTIAPLKRKRKHKSDDVTNATDMVGTADHETPRRRKRMHSEKHSEPTHGQTEGSTPMLGKNASRSSRQGIYPDPTKDAALTAPALKALSYVHTHVSSPDSWKFSKARQNWVVRNLWDDKAIPDMYFPSCVKYVANIRGNTRDMLTKSSQSVLDDVSENTANSDTVKPPVAVTVSEGAGEVESSEEQLRRRQMRVKRAEMILAALAEAKP
ncbi:hypothetical protein JB92DRAFT_2850658 [Gautieria morchelliformis]|nr:hypothetical protein JB92DRAFT_2850658 [Gautieria morchelliformis]